MGGESEASKMSFPFFGVGNSFFLLLGVGYIFDVMTVRVNKLIIHPVAKDLATLGSNLIC